MIGWMALRAPSCAPARVWTRTLLGGAALVGSLWGAAPPAAVAAPVANTIHTSRPKFRIPFQFDAEEMARLGAVEIRLFVSTDKGRHWKHAQSVAPGEGRFTFEATGEGEYWFAVRTVDGQGQLHPPGPPVSGLQVVVDQTAPLLNLQIRESRPGEVELSWQATDDHLDVKSLKLEFLDPGTTEWQAVNVTPAESGATSWTAPGGRVIVRASVADQAGNSVSAEASTGTGASAPAQPAAQPGQRKPDFSRPVAGPPPAIEAGDNVALGETPVVIPNGRDDLFSPISQTPVPLQSPIADSSRSPLPTASRAISGPTRAPVVVETPEVSRPEPEPEQTTMEAGIPTRHVRSRVFNIQYQLDDVGPSGVSNVDLYITENNGTKWFYYGPDEDRRSPMAVALPGDGEYGFSLRVRSGAGVVQDPPQPGDPPSFVVIVDSKPPECALGSVTQGDGGRRGQISIEWSVRDEHLVAKPVRLSWAPAREGPWRAMTDWIANTGRYEWTADGQAIASVFLRLEARDAAGNMSRVDSQTPLLIDSARPTARFTDVDPAATVPPQ